MTDLRRIGWIGTGVMGRPMAGHLLDAGFDVVVHTRTRSKAEPLLDCGASWAASAAEAADGADAVVSIVGFPTDVEAIHLGAEGTLKAPTPPGLIIDMTTSRPSLARRIAEVATGAGSAAIDAPVSGGDVGARNASLSIMLGGDVDAVARCRPLLEHLGSAVVHQGPPGAGQHTKMVNQVLIAGTMMGVCEGLLYAQRAGLDPTRVLESVGCGAAGSWTIDNLAPRMIARDFDPGFYVEHFIKDLGIALDEAKGLGLAMPGLTLAHQLYESVQALGLERHGTQALLLALEEMSGLPSEKEQSVQRPTDIDVE